MNPEIVSGKDIPGKVEDAAKQTRSPSTPKYKNHQSAPARPCGQAGSNPDASATPVPQNGSPATRAQTQKRSMSFPVFIGDHDLHVMQPPTPKIGRETLDTNFPVFRAQRFVAAVHGDRA